MAKVLKWRRWNRWCGRRPCRWFPRSKAIYAIAVGRLELVLQFIPWKGIAPRGWRKAAPWWTVPPPLFVQWECPEMKKKCSKAGTEAGKHLAALETNILNGLIPLVEHCAVRQYDDGDSRETGWITIKTTGAAWVVQVKDPDSCCSFAAVADTVDKALETAALLLSCDEAPWEPDRFLIANGKGKKK